MMCTIQSESAGIGPPRLHRPFKFYDPETVAILTILVGLFQVLLGIPVYFMSIDIHLLYMCPVLVGAVHVTGGSFAFACERSPSRQLLKNCFYSTLGGLLGGLCAIAVYGYAVGKTGSYEPCGEEQYHFGNYFCVQEAFVGFFRILIALLWMYDIAALVLQCFLSFSAFKGLKTN